MFDSLICLLSSHPQIEWERAEDPYNVFFPQYQVRISYKNIPYLTGYSRPEGTGALPIIRIPENQKLLTLLGSFTLTSSIISVR
jgi:hypothetical protein